MATKYTNLPGVFLDVLDGQLTSVPSPGDPIFLILGTTDTTQETIDSVATDIVWPYTPDSIRDATKLFGATSGLGKGIVEAASGGATNFRLWRTGAEAAGKRAQYEELFKAYDAMYDQPADLVVPYGVYLDSSNIMDMEAGTSAGQAGAVDGTDTNLLGRVYAKRVDGEWKFAWWYPENPADLSTVGSSFDSTAVSIGTFADSRLLGDITSGGIAEGSVRADYHEVNFAYQLADFCHRGSSAVDMRLGFIGVKAPELSSAVNFTSLSAQADWVGKSPTLAGEVVTANGEGLLGNKFMAGATGYRTAKAGGGFIAGGEDPDAKRGFAEENEQLDANGQVIDIGKYLSVVASWATAGTGTGHSASAVATYAGFVSTLAPQSAPTNKSLQGMLTVKGSVAAPSLDLLAGAKYVGLLNKATRSAVISDGPTAALATSDYKRLSTMRQIEECVDGIRLVSEPFLGEGMTAAELNALDTAVGSKLKDIQSRGIISSYQYQVLMSPQQKVLGEATVQLILVPAFELRRITLTVGLSAT